jgi:hypothetical protein
MGMEDLKEFLHSGFRKMHANDSDDHVGFWFLVSLQHVGGMAYYEVMFNAPAFANSQQLLKNNIDYTIIIQSQQLTRISFIDSDLEKVETVEDDKTFALFSLVIGGVDAAELLSAELDGVGFAFAEYIEGFFRDICNEVAKVIHADDVSCYLPPGGFYLPVDQSFEVTEGFGKAGNIFACGDPGGYRGEDLLFGKCGQTEPGGFNHPDIFRWLFTEEAEQSVVGAHEKVAFQLNDNEGIAAVAGSIDADQMHSAFGKIAEDRPEYKRRVAYIEHPDLVTDIDDADFQVDSKYARFNGCYVMITFPRIC